ncbi:Heat shock protein 60 family co-chaperone GroES, partial [hydrothermal vent metagenome]
MSTKKNNITANITPLGDRVLIKPTLEDEKKSASGIIIPETIDKEKPQQGKVIAVGAGRVSDDGKLIPVSVKKGETVLFSKYGPDEIKVDGEEYYILSES